MININCIGCGACCMLVKEFLENNPEIDFPYNYDDNGYCEMLDENMKCKVYDDRPEICSAEKMYHGYKERISVKEYISKVEESCRIIMKRKFSWSEEEIDKKYKDYKNDIKN